ncbi:cytochrome c biogenesis protein ResB, partial [Streptomyces sp. NPDC002130]|uniref:cytochrome c biogenesis protein ResB n=1 Tax=Streptomyces sp. NPDC002130 TaxID=3155568 RepID=UPI003326A283
MTDNATAGGRIRRLPRLIIRESVRLLRHNWRRLTSMSTALVLLFLLALAALPGAMLPQRRDASVQFERQALLRFLRRTYMAAAEPVT